MSTVELLSGRAELKLFLVKAIVFFRKITRMIRSPANLKGTAASYPCNLVKVYNKYNAIFKKNSLASLIY